MSDPATSKVLPIPTGNERIRALLVDDSPRMVELMESTLGQQATLQVVGRAGSGEEALEKAEALSPQLVLMDLMLPGMDGLEATRRLRLRQPEIHVIIITSLDGAHLRRLCLEKGAQGFVSKNKLPQALLDEIKRLFPEP